MTVRRCERIEFWQERAEKHRPAVGTGSVLKPHRPLATRLLAPNLRPRRAFCGFCGPFPGALAHCPGYAALPANLVRQHPLIHCCILYVKQAHSTSIFTLAKVRK